MIGGLKPYPEYKDSGVEWLGEVPGHWEVKRLGALLRERKETNDDLRVTEVLSVLRDRGVIPYAEKGNIGNKKSDDITRYKIVRPSDIVVNCMNVIIGSVGLSNYTGCLSPVYYVLTRRESEDDPRYLNAYFQTKPFQESLVRIGNGILAHRMRIPMELLKCEQFPRPPAPEQAAIVRFLDHADRRIRRYIRAKQRLIKLLEELKAAIVHRAVTRGLDPKVRLKPSGVEWLGDVPEHWEVRKLGSLARVFNGTTPSRGRPSYWQDGTVPWLASGKVNDWMVRSPTELITELALGECSLSLVPKGSVIIGLVGQGRTRAMSAMLAINACINQNLAAIVPARNLVGTFLLYWLTAHYQAIRETARGGNQEALNTFMIANLRMPIPSLSDQEEIALEIENATAGIDRLRAASQVSIARIEEYRIRLIADVVTGKLDVREAAARLPDEPEGTEPLDELESADDLEETGDDASEDQSEEVPA